MWRTLSATALIACSVLGQARAEENAPSTEITERQILNYAIHHAPAVRVARSRLRLGRAEEEAASPLLPEDPELSLSMGPRLSSSGARLEAEVSINQAFEIGGERGLRGEVARRSGQRLAAALERVRWQTHVEVHQAFHTARVAKERVRAATRLLAFAEGLLSIARRRQAAGAISALQTTLVEGEVSLARQAAIAARGRYDAARLNLAERAGWPAKNIPEPVGPLEAPRRLHDTTAFYRRALTRHPELQKLIATVREAEARTALASRERLPKPGLGVSYSREVEGDGTINTILLGTLSFRLPLWQRNQGPLARETARAHVARSRHEAVESALRVKMARALSAINTAAARVEAFGRDVLPSFAKNLDMLRRAFEEGKIDILQVMVARGRVLSVQQQSLDAYLDYYRARAALELALGDEPWPNRSEER